MQFIVPLLISQINVCLVSLNEHHVESCVRKYAFYHRMTADN